MVQSAGTPEVFPSLLAARDFLEDKGYRIPKSKIYRDKDAGKITLGEDGKTVTAMAAWEYAEKHLEKINVNSKDLKDLQARKINNTIRNQDLDFEKKQFEFDKDKGNYILRKDFEAELAARAVILESGFRHMFNTKAREWIALVGGKADKSADLLQALNTGLDEQLNNYASVQTFQVMFEAE
ncbi:MAG: hypothetical protein MI863_20700 [Desulfobacterales bacterium]|nr:hypothetical protein [Desulfobacterales bacterium]